MLDDDNIIATQLFAHYHQFAHHQVKALSRTNNHTVLVRAGDQHATHSKPWEDCISNIELDFIEALQDDLMTSYAQQGIAIEVNPSSNVCIGNIPDYHLHPIFRWNPPILDHLEAGGTYNRFGLRNGPVPVCVNADDPGIFPTNLQNEFALLKEGG